MQAVALWGLCDVHVAGLCKGTVKASKSGQKVLFPHLFLPNSWLID